MRRNNNAMHNIKRPHIIPFDIRYLNQIQSEFQNLFDRTKQNYLMIAYDSSKLKQILFKLQDAHPPPYYQMPLSMSNGMKHNHAAFILLQSRWHQLWIYGVTEFRQHIIQQLSDTIHVEYGALRHVVIDFGLPPSHPSNGATNNMNYNTQYNTNHEYNNTFNPQQRNERMPPPPPVYTTNDDLYPSNELEMSIDDAIDEAPQIQQQQNTLKHVQISPLQSYVIPNKPKPLPPKKRFYPIVTPAFAPQGAPMHEALPLLNIMSSRTHGVDMECEKKKEDNRFVTDFMGDGDVIPTVDSVKPFKPQATHDAIIHQIPTDTMPQIPRGKKTQIQRVDSNYVRTNKAMPKQTQQRMDYNQMKEKQTQIQHQKQRVDSNEMCANKAMVSKQTEQRMDYNVYTNVKKKQTQKQRVDSNEMCRKKAMVSKQEQRMDYNKDRKKQRTKTPPRDRGKGYRTRHKEVRDNDRYWRYNYKRRRRASERYYNKDKEEQKEEEMDRRYRDDCAFDSCHKYRDKHCKMKRKDRRYRSYDKYSDEYSDEYSHGEDVRRRATKRKYKTRKRYSDSESSESAYQRRKKKTKKKRKRSKKKEKAHADQPKKKRKLNDKKPSKKKPVQKQPKIELEEGEVMDSDAVQTKPQNNKPKPVPPQRPLTVPTPIVQAPPSKTHVKAQKNVTQPIVNQAAAAVDSSSSDENLFDMVTDAGSESENEAQEQPKSPTTSNLNPAQIGDLCDMIEPLLKPRQPQTATAPPPQTSAPPQKKDTSKTCGLNDSMSGYVNHEVPVDSIPKPMQIRQMEEKQKAYSKRKKYNRYNNNNQKQKAYSNVCHTKPTFVKEKLDIKAHVSDDDDDDDNELLFAAADTNNAQSSSSEDGELFVATNNDTNTNTMSHLLDISKTPHMRPIGRGRRDSPFKAQNVLGVQKPQNESCQVVKKRQAHNGKAKKKKKNDDDDKENNLLLEPPPLPAKPLALMVEMDDHNGNAVDDDSFTRFMDGEDSNTNGVEKQKPSLLFGGLNNSQSDSEDSSEEE
eukprot:183076_1